MIFSARKVTSLKNDFSLTFILYSRCSLRYRRTFGETLKSSRGLFVVVTSADSEVVDAPPPPPPIPCGNRQLEIWETLVKLRWPSERLFIAVFLLLLRFSSFCTLRVTALLVVAGDDVPQVLEYPEELKKYWCAKKSRALQFSNVISSSAKHGTE